MNARVHPLVALFMAVVAVPLLAQQGNPPTTGPAADHVSQPVASMSAASEQAEPVHVLGTIVTIAADRLDLKVEKAVEPSTGSAAALVGQTVTFLLDAKTEKPAELKANDRVDLYFTEANGERHAVRIVVAAEGSDSSNGAAEAPAAGAPPNPGTPASDQPAAEAATSPRRVEAAHVIGSIVTITSDRLDLKVEKAGEPSTESVAGLVGQTVTFMVDAKTDKPADLKAGDRVDLYFTEANGERHADRIVIAAAGNESSNGAAAAPAAVAPPNPGTPAAGQPAANQPAANQPAGSTAASSSAVTTNPPAENAPLNATAQPANHKAVTTRRHEKPAVAAPQPVAAPVLPNPATNVVASPPAVSAAQTSPAPSEPTGSVDVAQSGGQPQADTPPPAATRVQSIDPLRFIALGGAAGLVALVMLYFTLRARHLDLGIGSETLGLGSGKGGVG